jgi:hypothetical protein
MDDAICMAVKNRAQYFMHNDGRFHLRVRILAQISSLTKLHDEVKIALQRIEFKDQRVSAGKPGTLYMSP